MTRENVVNRMEMEIVKAGSLRALARKWEVSAAYLSDIRLGRRNPGPSILKRMGLKKILPRPAEATYAPTHTEKK